MKASSNRLSLLLIALSLQSVNLSTAYAQTRTITPAPDGTGTVINRQGNRFDINGGSVSRDGQNLFHSFEQFNLSEGQIANFLSNPNIRNILGRVVGGDASFINGLIEVTGGNSNLFLMNPAGIIFGANASLNIPASFTATTANGIGFGANTWFDVSSNSDWSNLVGTPNSFRFDTQNPGSIINLGELAVSSEQQLTLVAGTIISTGTLAAPEGTVSVQTVPGENVVRIVQTGHLLNLEVAALPANSVSNQPSITPLSLPELLTGGDATTANEIIVNSNGEIVLTSGQIVESGDIAVTPQQNLDPNNLAVTGETVTLKAANTLTIAERSLQTTGDLNLLAGNTVRVRDSLTHPFSAIAGGNLTVIGLQNIDILALDSINILGSAPFQAAGNLTLVSDGIISGDSHFNAGGNFNILNSIGTGGTFISLYDPIIYSDGDVVFGSYEGASLKVEATGAIIGGDINITTADINLANSADPEANILSSSPALILRSGVQNLGNSANINSNTSVEGTFFLQRPASGNNNLTVGNVTTAGGPVILNSTGRIVVDQINTQGGEVNLQAIDNIIIARNINSSGGNIEIITDDLLRVGTLIDPNNNTPSISSANGQIDGSITIEHGGGETPFIIGDATTNGTARSITSRSAQITPQFEVPRTTDGIFRQGNITIRTTPFPVEEPPTEPPPVEPPPVEPEEPITENPPPVEPPEEPSLPTNPGNNPPIDVPREENPNNPNNPGNETPEVPNNPGNETPEVPNNPGNETPEVPNNPGNETPEVPNNPGNETPEVPNNPGNPPVVNPPNNNPPPEVPSTPETRILTPEQQENVTTVIESELVERKNSFSSPVEELQNGSISLRNSGLDVSLLEDNSSATTVQQNADGTIGLLRYNSVITEPNTASEFNPQEAIQLARAELTESFDSNNIEQAVSQIDQVYSWEYLNYLGKNIEDVEGQVSLREIQDKLSEMDKKYGTKAAMIYVLAQSNELILMAISAKGDAIQKTIENVNRQELIEVSNQFRLEITDARKRYTSSYKPLSQQLYQWLVSPLEEAIDSQKIDTLLFVMDRGLRSLPLAALHDGEQFLIEKYNFSLIPSFSLMDIRDNPLNEPRVLAMGASKFTEQPPLPAVPLEVRSITKELGGEYFINEDFTINNFRTQRINHPYNIIHLATHSEFSRGDLSNSYIQFWDQKLTLNNFKQLGWKWDNPPAELLVLSACRTAIGDESAELGFAGLAVQAGVPSALASLWYVSDQGTLGLMIEFYNQLRNKPILSQAFRDAQLAMLRGEITIESGYLLSSTFIREIQLPSELLSQGNTVFTHPYYWAGFTLIGSPW
ncbi:MAG: CHAT domain-containing protein [Limnoraphis robusta]